MDKWSSYEVFILGSPVRFWVALPIHEDFPQRLWRGVRAILSDLSGVGSNPTVFVLMPCLLAATSVVP